MIATPIDDLSATPVSVWRTGASVECSAVADLVASGIRVVRLEDPAPVVVVELDQYDDLTRVRRLRQQTDAAMIALIDGDGTVDPVAVLAAGADDFVAQPCPSRELVAKVRAWLRRTDVEARTRARSGDVLEIDIEARDVRVRGEVVVLPPREFDLLAFLAQRPRHAFSRSELLAQVWSASDAWLGPATVTEHVRRLRRRIEADPSHPRLLRTVRRVGYCFDPDGA